MAFSVCLCMDGKHTHALSHTLTYTRARISLESEGQREREGYYSSFYTQYVCVTVDLQYVCNHVYSCNLVITKAVNIRLLHQHEEGEEEEVERGERDHIFIGALFVHHRYQPTKKQTDRKCVGQRSLA